MTNIDPNKKLTKKEQKEAAKKALKGFNLLDDRMKLQNPIWSACTRGAFHMGMNESDRMKLIAINLVLQNGQLIDSKIQDEEKIKSLESKVEELNSHLSPKN